MNNKWISHTLHLQMLRYKVYTEQLQYTINVLFETFRIHNLCVWVFKFPFDFNNFFRNDFQRLLRLLEYIFKYKWHTSKCHPSGPNCCWKFLIFALPGVLSVFNVCCFVSKLLFFIIVKHFTSGLESCYLNKRIIIIIIMGWPLHGSHFIYSQRFQSPSPMRKNNMYRMWAEAIIGSELQIHNALENIFRHVSDFNSF